MKFFKRIRGLTGLALVILILANMAYLFFHSCWLGQKLYPMPYQKIIYTEAKRYDLDPHLVAAVVYVESRCNPKAHSDKGALGLMQIMPQTGNWVASKANLDDFKVDDLYDPETNIKIGCWYLDNLRKQFDDNILLVLAAYNGGHVNVSEWRAENIWTGEWDKVDNIPFSETREYVKKVVNVHQKYQQYYP